MNFYEDKYADFIIKRMLRLQSGEKLSLNCNSETLPFAHKVAHIAAEESGLPVSLVYIENGKVESVDEIEPSFQVKEQKGVAMLHLASFPESGKNEELDAKALQEYRLLADPIFLDRRISVPWATAYVPTPLWAEFVYGPGATTDMLWRDIAELYELEDEENFDLTDTLEKSLSIRANKLNSLNLIAFKLESSTCSLYLPIAKRTKHVTSATRVNNRFFYPSFPCEDIAVAIDMRRAEGHFTTTMPFRLFDKIFEHASVNIKEGMVTGFVLEGGNDYITRFINIDEEAKRVGELILCDNMSRSSLFNRSLGLPVFDRMRGVSIVLGGVRPEAVTGSDESSLSQEGINTSFARLELPILSDSLSIIGVDKDNKETLIMENGSFTEEF